MASTWMDGRESWMAESHKGTFRLAGQVALVAVHTMNREEYNNYNTLHAYKVSLNIH